MKEALSGQVYTPHLKRVKGFTVTLVLPMDQDTIRRPDINSTICETSGCYAYATIEVDIPIGDLGKINLLCENCEPKSSDSKSWVSKI
jgi:hypothetical protein